MEKELKKARLIINKIVKNLGRGDIDWTVQTSISTIHPDKVVWCAQIEAPANGLAPLTWVKDSPEELIESLELASKGLDQEAVMRAYYESEIKRAEEKIKYYQESIELMDKES